MYELLQRFSPTILNCIYRFVFINVIGGIIIGVAQQGMGFADAARTYTLLTVGDGLVTQVPALIVSTAAGLLVSKAGVTGAADKAMLKQLSGYPQALGMSSGVMLVLALLPGIPMLPFLVLGGGAGWCKSCHATGTNYLGNMERKSLTHQSRGNTPLDCSQSGCHKPLGNKGQAYTKWD